MKHLDIALNRILFYFLLFLFLLKNTVFVNSTIASIVFSGIILLFTIIYIITYKIYNFKVNNVWFLVFLGFLLLQGLFCAYHYKFTYFKYFYDILRYITFIGFFLFGKFAFNNISYKGLVKWYLVIMIFHIITGYLSLILGEASVVNQTIRLGGEFENIGQFGLLMGVSVILFMMLYKYSTDLLQKILMAVFLVLVLGLLAFNNTMRIIVALAFAYFLYYVVYNKKYIYLLVITLALVAILLINKQVYTRLATILTANYDTSSMGAGHFENSFQWRLMQWYLLIKDWLHNYLLLGVGLGQQTVLHGLVTPWGEPYVAHSDFVKLLVETGLIGFSVVIYLFYGLYKYIKNSCYYEEFMIVFLYFLFCLMTGNTVFSNPIQIFAFLIGYFTMGKQHIVRKAELKADNL